MKLRPTHSRGSSMKKRRRSSSRRVSWWRRRRPNANEWTFEVGDPMGISPYVRLTPDNFEADIDALLDDDFQCFYASDITLLVDYPLGKPANVALTADNGTSFYRNELLRKIAKAYQDIYEEEERTTTLPVETMADRFPGGQLINRAETDDTYGIHSHQLAERPTCCCTRCRTTRRLL